MLVAIVMGADVGEFEGDVVSAVVVEGEGFGRGFGAGLGVGSRGSRGGELGLLIEGLREDVLGGAELRLECSNSGK